EIVNELSKIGIRFSEEFQGLMLLGAHRYLQRSKVYGQEQKQAKRFKAKNHERGNGDITNEDLVAAKHPRNLMYGKLMKQHMKNKDEINKDRVARVPQSRPAELQGPKSLEVSFHHVTKDEVELSHQNAELRLLEIFPMNEKIKSINYYGTLRAEEDHLIHGYHFTKDASQNQLQVQNFGKPFILVIRDYETLAELKNEKSIDYAFNLRDNETNTF
nr:hypothetical protein [Tanacetum cinerariifolium]